MVAPPQNSSKLNNSLAPFSGATSLWRLFTDQTNAEKLGLTYLPEAA